jgi:hypothetical protein
MYDELTTPLKFHQMFVYSMFPLGRFIPPSIAINYHLLHHKKVLLHLNLFIQSDTNRETDL